MSSISLKNPSLTLYAFHLLSDTYQDRREDADLLWKNIVSLAEPFKIPELNNFPNLLINEQNQDTIFLHLLPKYLEKYQAGELFCSIYPVRLHDTYAVDFTVFFKNKTVDIYELSLLNPNGCLLPNTIKASIGQTLVFYAEVEDKNVKLDKTLAETCARAVVQVTDNTKIITSEGQLFGSPLFECEIKSNPTIHILVWFGNHSQTIELAGKNNNWLIKLLCQRHKILYVSQLAQEILKPARKIYRELEKTRLPDEKLPKKQHLEKLETLLKEILPIAIRYTTYLAELSDHKTTILTNRINYGKSLDSILKSVLSNDNIAFWQTFYAEESERLHQQVDINLAYLSPIQPLIQQIIDITLSSTHIKTLKDEFDKQESLERIVVFIATILESTAISVKVDHFYQLPELFKEISHEGIFSSVLGHHFINILPHLGIGFVFGIFAVFILWIYQKIRDK